MGGGGMEENHKTPLLLAKGTVWLGGDLERCLQTTDMTRVKTEIKCN